MDEWKKAFRYKIYLLNLAKDIIEMAKEMQYTESYLYQKEMGE